jgi:3-deoxy-D-manno-octulosonic-acid transferase
MSLLLDVLYLLALIVLSPWLVWRAIRTGRYRRDLFTKLFGTATRSNPERKPLAWFHGVSVGEIHLLVTVVAAFRKRNPDWITVVSSTTDTGLAEARAKFEAVVPYPFDFSWACRATLNAVNPSLVVLAESELWPNFLAVASARRIPVVVINARMSPRSFARLNRVKAVANRLLFRHVSVFAVQSSDYADRFRQLGVPKAKLVVSGSVKYDGATGERDTAMGRELRRLLIPPSPGGRGTMILVAGSTHAPEEEILLGVFGRLRSRYTQLCLLLVPRHPDRFAEVAELVQRSGMSFVRRSQIVEPLSEMPAIVLLDTVGELGAAWGLADIGYTGGSLDGKRGGQSMIEPAGYGVPTVFGPYVWNFRDAAQRLVEAGAAVMVPDAAELETVLAALIEDAGRRQQMGEAARTLVKNQQGATARTLDVLNRVIERIRT